MKKSILISIPAYNESENVFPLYEKLNSLFESIDENIEFEILFVNDGSTDDTVNQVLKLAKTEKNISLINLSRNYGKEIAMSAGFDYSKHDAVITMDADLQHPPIVIKEMIRLWKLGYEDVYAKRNKRKGESWFKKSTSKMFYKVLEKLSDTSVLADAGDFRLLDKKVVNALRQLRESQRYTKGLYNWVGFKKISISPSGFIWSRSYFGGIMFIIIALCIVVPTSFENIKDILMSKFVLNSLFYTFLMVTFFTLTQGFLDICNSYNFVESRYSYIEKEKEKGNKNPVVADFNFVPKTKFAAYGQNLSHISSDTEYKYNKFTASYFGVDSVKAIPTKEWQSYIKNQNAAE